MRGKHFPARVKCTRVGRVRQDFNKIIKRDKRKRKKKRGRKSNNKRTEKLLNKCTNSKVLTKKKLKTNAI